MFEWNNRITAQNSSQKENNPQKIRESWSGLFLLKCKSKQFSW